MSADDNREQNGEVAAPPTSAWQTSHDDSWSSGELLRLLVVPAVVTVLFVGGVYWIRLQNPAGSAGQQQSSIVQVHLMPRSDATPVFAQAPDSILDNLESREQAKPPSPDPAEADTTVAMSTATAAIPESSPSSMKSAPALLSGPPSSVAIKFQQALLRHVARFQRYPKAARAQGLQGKVDTQFSISRDGTLLEVWVSSGSGQVILDNEAIETIRRARPLPAIPSGLPDHLTIHVQLVFEPA
jgi:protein TonB